MVGNPEAKRRPPIVDKSPYHSLTLRNGRRKVVITPVINNYISGAANSSQLPAK
jgi:hypothetical protein